MNVDTAVKQAGKNWNRMQSIVIKAIPGNNGTTGVFSLILGWNICSSLSCEKRRSSVR
jgi:hypothetical protein